MSENARDNGLCREHRGLRQMIKPSDLKVVNENEQYYLKAGEDSHKRCGRQCDRVKNKGIVRADSS